VQCALFIQIKSDVRVVPKCRALGAPIRNRGCETKRRGDNMRIRRAHYENLIAALPRATFHAPRVQRAASASVKRRAAEEVSLCIPMSLDSALLFALSAKLLFKHTHSAPCNMLSIHSILRLSWGHLMSVTQKSSSSPPADEKLRHHI
jgi:hypothetical protein